jgi:hypothetical protein
LAPPPVMITVWAKPASAMAAKQDRPSDTTYASGVGRLLAEVRA